MKQLLKFECRKLWQSKAFYIIFGVGLVSLILSMVSMKVLVGEMTAAETILFALQYSNFASLLIGVYVTIFACTDFSQQTIKNIYARGYNRTAVYFSKYLVSLVVTLLSAIFYMAFSFVFALILGGKVGTMPNNFSGWDLLLQLWVLIGIHGLYFGISMMIGKIAGSLVLNLVGVSLVFTIINIILSMTKIDFNILDYQLENVLTGLSPVDTILNGLSEPVVETPLIPATKPALARVIILPICYAVIFITGGWLVNRRRDV